MTAAPVPQTIEACQQLVRELQARQVELEAQNAVLMQAHDQLERSPEKKEPEALFRRLVEQAPDIIYRYRLWPEAGFEYVNPAVTALTGYTPADHYADPALGMKLVHPDDRALLAQITLGVGDSDKMQYGLRWLCKDGAILHTDHHCTVIRDEHGRPIAIEGITRDVTAAVAAQAALQQNQKVLDLANDTIFIWDAGGRITYWNKGAERLYGWTAAEAVGQPMH